MADALNPNIPLAPPVEWFTPPTSMPKDAGCIVEASGRVYGYLCHWGSILMDGTTDRWKPPRSRHAYAFAHTGDTVCEDGTVVKTANLGGDAGHAPTGQTIEDIQTFYENTSSQLARVRYGEDEHGVWFAGACWPTVTDLEIAKMRASARSGHWAVVGDWKDLTSGRQGYELVGACLVNVPGLKYARADRAASGVITINPCAFAGGADHDGAMVAVFLDADVANSLAVDDGEPPEQLHVTLAYFEDAAADRDDWEAAHDLIAGFSTDHLPLDGKVSGRGVFFQDDGGVVHWASPDVPGLSKLREQLCAALEDAGFAVRADHGFNPHITLRYDEDDKKDAPMVGVHDIRFDKLTLAVGGNMTKLATKPTKPATFAAVSDERRASAVAAFAADEEGIATADGVPVGGVLVIEGAATEDGRIIELGAAEWRETPLPLYSGLSNLPGHEAAALVGRIDEVWRTEGVEGQLEWKGTVIPTLSDGAGQATLDAIEAQALRGISIDGIVGPEDYVMEGDGTTRMQKIVIAGATLTPMPAIAGAGVTLLAGTTEALMAEPNAELQNEVDEEVADQTESADQFAAVNEKLDAILSALGDLAETVSNASMSARLRAVERRLTASGR